MPQIKNHDKLRDNIRLKFKSEKRDDLASDSYRSTIMRIRIPPQWKQVVPRPSTILLNAPKWNPFSRANRNAPVFRLLPGNKDTLETVRPSFRTMPFTNLNVNKAKLVEEKEQKPPSPIDFVILSGSNLKPWIVGNQDTRPGNSSTPPAVLKYECETSTWEFKNSSQDLLSSLSTSIAKLKNAILKTKKRRRSIECF